jgi:nucleolar complex protein 2
LIGVFSLAHPHLSKPPIASAKQQALQNLINAYFKNGIHLMTQLTDAPTIVLALNELAKIVPYITSSRRIVKAYLKACLTFWSSGHGGDADDGGDSVRIAAFLAIRRLTRAGDQAITELALKV